MQPLQQYGAMPFVETPRGRLVLLITSRDSGRWVIPKGWPKPRLTPRELVALEALEEAGIAGVVGAAPLGSYTYIKRLNVLSWVRCRVEVYPLQVGLQHLDWVEKSSRSLLWCAPEDAASRVKERGLAKMLRGLGQAMPGGLSV